MKKKNSCEDSQTVLVTGGAGFIGSNLAEGLLNLGFKVIIFDNFQTGRRENIAGLLKNLKCQLVEGDVNNKDEILPIFIKNRIDYVYHYAACVGVERTLNNPCTVLADIEGIKNIVSLATMSRVKRVFYSSSSEVYGESASFPQNERVTPLNSCLPYSVVKNLGEIFIKTYHREYGLNYTIFRFFNTYGPRQSENFVISKFISQALEGQDITVYGDGMQARTFLYIGDNVKATIAAIFKEESRNLIINIGNDVEISIKQLAREVLKVVRSKSKLKFLPPLKEGDMSRRLPDVSLMKQVLGVSPRVFLSEGICQTVKYFKEMRELYAGYSSDKSSATVSLRPVEFQI